MIIFVFPAAFASEINVSITEFDWEIGVEGKDAQHCHIGVCWIVQEIARDLLISCYNLWTWITMGRDCRSRWERRWSWCIWYHFLAGVSLDVGSRAELLKERRSVYNAAKISDYFRIVLVRSDRAILEFNCCVGSRIKISKASCKCKEPGISRIARLGIECHLEHQIVVKCV